MQRYSVVNIFRTNEHALSFIVSLMGNQREYYRIDKSLTERVARGMVYIGDRIEVRELTADGIIFEVLNEDEAGVLPRSSQEPRGTSEDPGDLIYDSGSYEIKPFINPNVRFLPYLCDVLPYSETGIEEMRAEPDKSDGTFSGRYKVGEMWAYNIKLPLSGMFIGKILHKTRINLYPNSFNPFFFIIVSSGEVMLKVVFWIENLKQYSGLQVGDVVMVKEYRRRKKWAVFDKIEVNTFTESVYFDVEEVTAKDLVKIQFDRKSPPKCIFEQISGRIEYLSVLMRYNYNDSLMEYVLMHVGDRNVVLFYNSDPKFYKIQVGMVIRIIELRKMERSGCELFVSTIYTQFEIDETSEETPKKPKLDRPPEIFGAIGFLPDNFKTLSEVTDYFHRELVSKADQRSREVSVNLFMRPVFLALDELKHQPLVLNESKKFMVNSIITKIAEVECVVDYLANGNNTKQTSFAVVLDDQVVVFVYENFFARAQGDYLEQMLKNREEELVGRPHNLVIEAFRTDEMNVLYYLTGIIV